MNRRCPKEGRDIESAAFPKQDKLPEVGTKHMELFLEKLKDEGFEMDICGLDFRCSKSNHEAIQILSTLGIQITIKNWRPEETAKLKDPQDVRDDDPLLRNPIPLISIPKQPEKLLEKYTKTWEELVSQNDDCAGLEERHHRQHQVQDKINHITRAEQRLKFEI